MELKLNLSEEEYIILYRTINQRRFYLQDTIIPSLDSGGILIKDYEKEYENLTNIIKKVPLERL